MRPETSPGHTHIVWVHTNTPKPVRREWGGWGGWGGSLVPSTWQSHKGALPGLPEKTGLHNAVRDLYHGEREGPFPLCHGGPTIG